RDLRVHTTSLTSRTPPGPSGNSSSFTPSISAGGRFVAFASSASNLVAHDTNGFTDVFVRDRKRHTTRLVSLSSSGQQGNDGSFLVDPAITPDGRFVAFTSLASNLVAGGTSGEQVFLRDLSAHKTKLISQSSTGQQANN